MWELGYRESWVPKKWCFWTVVLEKTLESYLGSKEIKPVHPRGNHYLIFTGRTDDEAETPVLWTTWCKELTHLKRSWCLERLKAGGEGDDRGWDSWIASPTQWTWVWVNSRSLWWTGRPGVLRFMGSQRVRHDWGELNWLNRNLGPLVLVDDLMPLFNPLTCQFTLNYSSPFSCSDLLYRKQPPLPSGRQVGSVCGVH